MTKVPVRIYITFLLFIIGRPVQSFAEAFDPFGPEKSDTQPVTVNVSEKGPIIPQVQFSNNEIAMAFQIISDSTGWSVFPTTEASKEKVSLWSKNITALDLLDQVVTTAGLLYHREGNIITVSTYDEYLQFYGLAKKIVSPKYAEAEVLGGVIKPFLTKLGKCIVHKETNSIVIFEVDANLKLIESVIEKLDSPSDDIGIEVIGIEYADSESLAKTLQDLFSSKTDKSNLTTARNHYSQPNPTPLTAEKKAKSQTIGGSSTKNVEAESQNTFSKEVNVFAIGQTNQLIIKARKPEMKKIKELVKKLDTYMESTTRSYQFHYVEAVEVYKGLEQVLNITTRYQTQQNPRGGASKGLTLLEKTNAIVLTAPPSTHRIMTSITKAVDIPAPYEASIVRVYKLENADVTEVADVIRELIGENDKQEENAIPAKYASSSFDPVTLKGGTNANSVTGSNKLSPEINLEKSEEILNKIQAKVSVSKSTNSIIVLATAREQREMAKIIQELDRRRQQVLIKAMIVEVTTTDNFELGVELGNAKGYHLEFSSFGLSSIDPKTGQRTVVVSPGGTAAYLDTDDVQAIVHALKTDGNVKVSSEPQVLVNDNAAGTIQSVAEEPVTQVNASETVATTSFAGFVEAGTQFKITPHISEKDYLRVEYEIILNTFGARSTDPSIPPPRNTSSITSEATVPNAHTIVVGGLQTVDKAVTYDKIPVAGDIPILGVLFRKQRDLNKYKTTYLFITPTIMKCKDFSDLKNASEDAQNHIQDVEEKSKTRTQKVEEKLFKQDRGLDNAL